jgi:predicted double-glycine peptidase
MLLWYKGKRVKQGEMANFSFGTNDACGNSDFYWNSWVNRPNSVSAITDILNHWNLRASHFSGCLSWSALQNSIDNRKPFIILKTWNSGGGHFVVGKGYSSSHVFVNDPWPGNGSSLQSYEWLKRSSQHTWTWTNYLR